MPTSLFTKKIQNFSRSLLKSDSMILKGPKIPLAKPRLAIGGFLANLKPLDILLWIVVGHIFFCRSARYCFQIQN